MTLREFIQSVFLAYVGGVIGGTVGNYIVHGLDPFITPSALFQPLLGAAPISFITVTLVMIVFRLLD